MRRGGEVESLFCGILQISRDPMGAFHSSQPLTQKYALASLQYMGVLQNWEFFCPESSNKPPWALIFFGFLHGIFFDGRASSRGDLLSFSW